MTHSDDTGLVCPPKVAPIQIVITPIWRNEEQRETVLAFTDKVHAQLKGHFRIKVDDREGIKPGAKYYEWERKGVPLRLEIGARDVENNSVFSARRTGGKKSGITVDSDFVGSVHAALDSIQQELLDNAIKMRDERTYTIESYQELLDGIGNGGFFLAPWMDSRENEAKIKDDCKATIRCYPTEQGSLEGKVCFFSGEPATHWALFARAY
jgi:prolyl-tRNA synthetase